ncbi:uncharacterized protein LOC134286466 [Aedes albopictus]|uniref:RRM domain-containing protein n=1 Tax=Aedes albopictus TaxID=7160 RepID=A0ABM1YYQ9_AEDAL
MASIRKNTLVVDFNVLPVRPSAADIEKFLSKSLEIEMTSVKNLQLHTIRNCALIEMRTLEAAERLASAHHLKHSMQAGKNNFNIPVYVEDTAINVRIHDLPPSVPNSAVAEHMKQYGKVISVARELWKKFFRGIPNGVRVVRIELSKYIPSFIRIQDQLTAVSYRSQVPTCMRCEQKAHPKLKCSEAATKNKARHVTALNTYDIQPTNEHSVADNPVPMDFAVENNNVEANAIAEHHRQQSKRDIRQTSPTDSNAPPCKKAEVTMITKDTITAARSFDDDENGFGIAENEDTDTDDSGPDPAKDDVDGWLVKLVPAENCNIILSGTAVEWANEADYLGLTLDSKLIYKQQVDKTVTKCKTNHPPRDRIWHASLGELR